MEALEALYKGMSKPVYFYALRLVGNPDAAQDLMQDTFVSVMKGSADFAEGGKGSSWLFTIAHNHAVNYLKKEGRCVPVDEAEEQLVGNDTAEVTDSEDAFFKMTDCLSRKERDVVVLRLLSGMTLTQISKELGIPKGSVFWLYSNAVKKLKKHIPEVQR